MKVAVSSLGSSLDAWAGGSFDTCVQFLLVDTETDECVVISVPHEQQEASKVSLAAMQTLARQKVEAIITGHIKDLCRQALFSLGIDVIDGVSGMTVRDAIALYATGGKQAILDYSPPPAKIAVAAHGNDLDAKLSAKEEVCTSFVLVEPETMAFQIVQVEPADSIAQASVNAVRAAAKSGATVVITPQIRPACCTALRALAITVALADENWTVRQTVQAYRRGELGSPSYV